MEGYGFEDIEITSVRNSLEGFDAGWYATDCKDNTDFTRYIVVDPETHEQTVYDSREELKDAYKRQEGELPERLADYCHSSEFTPNP